MSRSLQFASFLPRSGMNRVAVAALLIGAGSFSLLRSQSPATTANPVATTALPAAPAPVSDSTSVAAAFGQNQSQLASGSAGSRQSSRSMLDPFEPGSNFGNFSGSASAVGFNSTNGFAEGHKGGFGMVGRQGTAGPLFPNCSGMAGSSIGPFGPTSQGSPSFNQLMRAGFNLPLSSSTSNLRFSSQYALRSGGNPAELARPSMMFSTSDLGNGMFFSAGTSYGRSMAGAPAAALSSNASPEGKHSGPSVALKLSF